MEKTILNKWFLFGLLIVIIILVIIVTWLCKEDFIDAKKSPAIPYDYQLLYRSILTSTPNKLNIKVEPYDPNKSPPKKIFRTWCSKDLNKSCGGRPASLDAIEHTQKVLGNEWEQIIYDDKKIEEMLDDENFLGKNHTVTKAYRMLNPKYGAARADLFRYLIIYRYGGLYLDMKSCVFTNDIPPMPKGKDMITSSWSIKEDSPVPAQSHLFPGSGEYQNWYIYARPRAPILLDIIERVVQNIYDLYEKPYLNLEILAEDVPDATPAKNKVLTTTGPIALTIAIMNSTHKNTVLIYEKMNKILEYFCTYADWDNTNSKHYSMQVEPLVQPMLNASEIPKTAYFTYHNLMDIPKYVMSNIKKYCANLDVQINDDKQCEDFLLGFFGKESVDIFKSFELGAHKADFWRYCNLYVNGGCYFDIKTDFQVPILEYYNFNKSKQWYTVIDRTGTKLYNGIIITPPFNPVIGAAIKFIYNNNPPSRYDLYIENLFTILQKMCSSPLKVGTNQQSNGWICTLLQEHCTEDCGDDCDRYNLKCDIRDITGKVIYNTRYNDFPWKSNNIKEKYVNPSKSKAQFGQDIKALEYLDYKKDGTYLEIGVYDGENDNNTVLLDQEYNWSGLCIDPEMSNMDNRTCQKFHCALGSEPGIANFRYSNDEGGLNALDKFGTSTENEMWKDTVKNFEIKQVNVRTPEDVLEESEIPHVIDYMSLDVEGAEMDILRSFPFDKYCIKFSTIETNNDKNKEAEMEDLMTQKGYTFYDHPSDGVDHIFVKDCSKYE